MLQPETYEKLPFSCMPEEGWKSVEMVKKTPKKRSGAKSKSSTAKKPAKKRVN